MGVGRMILFLMLHTFDIICRQNRNIFPEFLLMLCHPQCIQTIRVNGVNVRIVLNMQEYHIQIVKQSNITTVTSTFLLSLCKEQVSCGIEMARWNDASHVTLRSPRKLSPWNIQTKGPNDTLFQESSKLFGSRTADRQRLDDILY